MAVTATDVEEEAAWVVSQIKDLLAETETQDRAEADCRHRSKFGNTSLLLRICWRKTTIPYDPPDLQSRSSRQPAGAPAAGQSFAWRPME